MSARQMQQSPQTELCGFVCPECMLSLSSSDELLQHFEVKHNDNNNIKKVDEYKSAEKPCDDNSEERYNLLQQMSRHNNTLIKRVSTDNARILELESLMELLLSGLPLPADASFSDTALMTRIGAFLDEQATHAVNASMLEALQSQLRNLQKEKKESSCSEFPSADNHPSSEHLAAQQQLVKDKEELEKRLAICEKNLSVAQEEIGQLKTSASSLDAIQSEEVKQLKREKDKLGQSLIEANSKCELMQTQMDALRETRSSADVESAFSTKLAGLEANLVESSTRVTQVTAERDDARLQLSQVQQSLDATEAPLTENIEGQTTLDKVQSELSKARKLCDQLSIKLTKVETERDQFQSSLLTNREQHDQLSIKLANLEVERSQFQSELLTRRKQSDELSTNLKKVETERDETQVQLLISNERHSQLTSKLAKVEADGDQTQAKLVAIREKLSQVSTELARVKSERDTLDTSSHELHKQLNDSQQQVDQLKNESSKAEQTRNELLVKNTAIVQNLTQQLENTNQEREHLRVQSNELRVQCDQLIEAAEQEKNVSNDANEKLRSEGEELRAQLSVARKEADSLLERLIKAEDQSSTLRDQLTTQLKEIETLKKAMFDLGRENQSLQVLRERVATRQWTRDDEVLSCLGCQREFSLSNRRHHCRNCGGVFCQSCSSRRASTAASKDPVRVCNKCHSELIPQT